MMERVDHPSKVVMVPGEPWTTRIKYTAVDELIADYEQSNALLERQHCPVLDYFRAHRDAPLEDVEAYVYGHPAWGPTALCETMYRTLLFNNADAHEHGEFTAGWVQHYCALQLHRHKWNDAAVPLTSMLKHPEMRFVSTDALYVTLAYLAQHHPNPKRFLMKPEVLAKLPADLDVTGFACPDFPEIQNVIVRGTGR